MFGYPVPQEILDAQGKPVRYWGARAIFKPYSKYPIDLLPDRQGCECQDGRDPQPILDWMNKVGMPKLRTNNDFCCLSGDSNKTVEIKEGQFTLRVSPNSSYGYLYMGCWQYYPANCQYELSQCPTYAYYKPDEPISSKAKWSGKFPPPPIGAWVKCSVNGVWYGHVTGYFVEHGFLGIETKCHRCPEFFYKQKGDKNRVLFFGIDIQEVKQAA